MNQEYWTLEREREVTAYLISLREAGAELRAAIRSLNKGIPQDAYKVQDDPETWRWVEARHWIVFVVDRPRKWINVTLVESATEE